MSKSEPVVVSYQLDGGWLYAVQQVSAAPEATSFAFYVVNEETKRFTASTPPVRGGDDQIGRSYRVPGPLPVPMPVDEVLALLNGCILESSLTCQPGDGGFQATATLVLFQEQDGAMRELGQATVPFEERDDGEFKCRPRIALEGV
jgi:hypothetical protein